MKINWKELWKEIVITTLIVIIIVLVAELTRVNVSLEILEENRNWIYEGYRNCMEAYQNYVTS